MEKSIPTTATELLALMNKPLPLDFVSVWSDSALGFILRVRPAKRAAFARRLRELADSLERDTD